MFNIDYFMYFLRNSQILRFITLGKSGYFSEEIAIDKNLNDKPLILFPGFDAKRFVFYQ